MGLKEFTILSFLAIFVHCTIAASTMEPQFLDSLQSFGPKTFAELYKSDHDKNIIFSPLSLQTVLAMTRLGASGDTATEMDHVLGFGGQTPQSIADSYQNFLSKYESDNNLKLANKVYIKQGFELQDNYKELMSKKFFSSAENVNFGDSEKAAQIINTWVESKTNNKIQNLIASSLLSEYTRLVLVNAIHFKGQWKNPFVVKETAKRDFYMTENNAVKVDTMSIQEHFEGGDVPSLDSSVLRLPYKDSDLSMLIIVPNQREGLTTLVDKLNRISLHSLKENLRYSNRLIYLPKFNVEYEKSYKSDLIKMGMQQVFGSSADLSNMLASPEPLQVDEVVQKAFIEVTEFGTEAAGASGVTVHTRTIFHPFVIDHPFYYAIITDDFIPVFQGTVVKF